jgi:hypothetical protein
MLARLPLKSAVVSVRGLARRLVLTTADAPLGEAPHLFVSVRLKLLLDAGLVDDAGKLAAMAGPTNDRELARLVADSLLFAGRAGDLCGALTDLRLKSSEPFWVELRAYCYAMAGDENALDLTHSVMNAENIRDPGFDTLLSELVEHGAQAPEVIQQPTSLDVFLCQVLHLPIDPSWSQYLGMPASVAAMRDGNNSPQQRFEAARDVAVSGAASAAELAAVADAQTFTPDDLERAASVAPTLPFFAGQALLRQAIQRTADAGVRRPLVFEAFRLADEAGLLPTAAELQGDAASAVKPSAQDRAQIPLITAALMLGGHAEAAARWYDVLDPKSDANKPLIHLLQAELDLVAPGSARDFEAQGALSWFAGQAEDKTPVGGEPTRPLALLVLGTFEAVGMALPQDAAKTLAVLKGREWPGRRPGTELFTRLAGASRTGRHKGDTVLSMLDFIGPGGPGDVAPDATVAFVKAMAKLDYADAARDLAVDALLLHRPPPPQPVSASAS